MVGRKALLLLFFFILTVGDILYTVEGKVSCDCGYNFITKQFPVKFTVTELPVEYDCLTEEFENGNTVWPGPPMNLNVTTSYPSFSLSWKPPDDSSVQHVTGFLLRLFVEDFTPLFSMDPDACYFINFTHTQVLEAIPYGYVLQDSVVNVHCHVTQLPPIDVRIYLTSLPLPSVYRQYKEITGSINFEDNSQIRRTTREHKPTLEVNIEEDHLDDIGARESAVMTVCVLVLSTGLIVTIVFAAYRMMKNFNKDNSLNNNQEPGIDHEDNTKSLVDAKKANTVNRKTNTKLGSVQQYFVPTKGKYLMETTHDAFEEVKDTYYEDNAYSLPEKYRHVFMSINLES